MSRKALGHLSVVLSLLTAFAVPPSLSAAPFTPGNLVVYRVGDGTGSLVNTGSAVFLDEYTAGGTLVQSIGLPTTVSGANKQLIASGTATSEGLLTRSADFRYLMLTGYARNLGGSGSLAGTSGATVPRTIGRVDASGTVDTSTALSDFADGNNPRGAISSDGTQLWAAGGAGGLRFATLGGTTSTQISTTVTNLRQPAIFNSQLHVSTSSGSAVRIGTAGSGLPTTSGQTITNLPGFPTSGSPYAFVLLDLSAGVAGLDTLYVADDGAGLLKFSLVSGSWTSNGTVGTAADAYRGLTASASGGTVTLFATRKGGSGAAGGGELVTLTDASGYNGAFSGTPALLATAANNTAFRGVAFAPEPAPGPAAQNVAIYRVGDGAAGLVNTGSAVFVDEIRPDGVVVRSIPLPVTASGAQKQLLASGTATSEGLMTRSTDGRYLVLTGYARNLGGAGSLSGTASATVNRTVGRVDAGGAVDTSTALVDFADGNNPRGAASVDGSGVWVTGGAGGIRFASFGATTSTQLSTTVTNLRQPEIFGNQLFVSTSSGSTVRIGTVGTGLPATSGQTITNLPGFPTSGSPYAFVLFDLDAGIAGLDTLYVADDGIGLAKYSLVSGSWTGNGTVGTAADAYRGLTATVSGGTVTLYATRKGGSGATGGGELVVLADASGYNGAFAGTPSLLATAANNTAYRGVALMPVCSTAELAVTRTAPASGLAGTPYDYTLVVSNQGAVAASGITVQFTLPVGVTFTSATGIGGFSPSFSTGVATFSGGALPAGTAVQLTVRVTPTGGGTVTSAAGDVVVDPGSTLSECNETANNALVSAATVIGVPNTPPTIQAAATTTAYLSLPAAGPGHVSGVLADPTDPASTLGIDFTIGDAETAAGSLTVTAASSNAAVVPDVNLVLTGTGASRNLKIVPVGIGYATVTVTVSDGTTPASYTIHYAASAASVNPSTTRFLTGASDASTALAVDADYMLVADDENQVLRLYRRDHSGLPVAGFDYTASLGLTDLSGGIPREVDIEASTRIGNRLYWMASHGNASSGNLRPNRARIFATDLTGTGASATLSYVGRYDGLKADLINWDDNNLHGLGASHYGLAASTVAGLPPESPAGDGFNLEGFTLAPDGTTAFLAFRAPLVPPGSRTKALVVPLTNLPSLVSGNPSAGPATFGAPIELDLGGRGIRSIECHAAGCLLTAGPVATATGVPPSDFRLYTWSGNAADAPSLRTTDLTALAADGSFESIVELPSPLTDASPIQLLVDNGDTVYYGDGIIAKDLGQGTWKKFRSEIVTAPAAADLGVTVTDAPDPVTPGAAITYTITVANAGPSDAASLTLSDTLPAGTAFVSLSSPGGWSCSTPAVGSSGTVSCTSSLLAASGSSTFTLIATTAAGLASGTLITNTATAGAATADPKTGNESGSATTTVGQGAANISLTKTAAPDPVTVGSNLVYTLTAVNAGPSDAATVALSDPLPAGTAFVSLSSPGGWSCTAPAVGSSGTVDCSIPSFPIGSAVFTLTVQAGSAVAGGTVLSNTATLTSATPDGNPGDTTATATANVVSPALVTATKTVSGTFQPASSLTYTIVLHNNSATAQQDNPGDELTDAVPAALTLVSANASSGTAGTSGNTVTWNGSIPAGGTVTITIIATVPAAAPAGTSISNQASYAYDADGNGTNEAAGVTDDPSAGGAGDPTAFVVGRGVVTVEIPALGPAGLAGLAVLLALAGALMLLRRRGQA